jgi:hypothetical protein
MSTPDELEKYHHKIEAVLPDNAEDALKVLGVSLSFLFRAIPLESRQEKMASWMARLIEVEMQYFVEDEQKYYRNMH